MKITSIPWPDEMDDTSVIKPIALGPPLGKTAVMAATRPDVERLAGQLGFGPDYKRDDIFNRIYTPQDKGPGVTLTGPFIGAPYAVMLLENMICRGINTVIFMGWCGSVSPDACTGDILIPTEVFSDEGTSRQYDPDACDIPRKTDESLIQNLKDSFQEHGVPYKTGSSFSTDAIYRETPEKIDAFRGKGALAVDMELSALLTVAAFRNIRLASVLVVSDEVWTHTWKPGFFDPRFKQSRKLSVDVVASLMKRMV